MISLVKTTATCVLLALVLLQSGGLFLFYKGQQWHIQYDQFHKRYDCDQNLRNVSLGIADFLRCKVNSHEIDIEGKRYDIHSLKMDSDSVHLTVVHDVKEERIIGKIMALFSQETRDEQQMPTQLLKLIQLTYVCPPAIHFVTKWDPEIRIVFIFQNVLSSQDKEIPYPPPKIV